MLKRILTYSLTAMALISNLEALPKGEKIASGQARFDRNDGSLVITTSDKAIVNYDSFNIGELENVKFIQPGASSCVLNRINGGSASSILGELSANGKVFLVNPYGVYFGQQASVNVGSLFASTLDIADNDFLSENYRFVLDSGIEGSIINDGHLSVGEHGVVALLSPNIRNTGVITAQAGKVLLAGAEVVTLDFAGDGTMSFALEGDLNDALIEHLGTIQAPESDVSMHVKTASQAIKTVVNTDGVAQANKIEKKGGVIRLSSGQKTAGRHVDIQADQVEVAGSTVAKGNLTIEGKDLVQVRDQKDTPLIAQAYREMAIKSDKIDILALDNTETSIASGSHMTFTSDNAISADGHFWSGGNFSLTNTKGGSASFISLYDPIISATGNVSFDAYTGVSLKVQSTGTMYVTGAINITGPDLTIVGGTPDEVLLSTTPSLILRAGVTLEPGGVAVPPDFTDPASGTTFTTPGGVVIGDINLQGGGITLTPSLTSGGVVILNANGGRVNVAADSVIDTGLGLPGSVTIDSTSFTSVISGSFTVLTHEGQFSTNVGIGSTGNDLTIDAETVTLTPDADVSYFAKGNVSFVSSGLNPGSINIQPSVGNVTCTFGGSTVALDPVEGFGGSIPSLAINGGPSFLNDISNIATLTIDGDAQLVSPDNVGSPTSWECYAAQINGAIDDPNDVGLSLTALGSVAPPVVGNATFNMPVGATNPLKFLSVNAKNDLSFFGGISVNGLVNLLCEGQMGLQAVTTINPTVTPGASNILLGNNTTTPTNIQCFGNITASRSNISITTPLLEVGANPVTILADTVGSITLNADVVNLGSLPGTNALALQAPGDTIDFLSEVLGGGVGFSAAANTILYRGDSIDTGDISFDGATTFFGALTMLCADGSIAIGGTLDADQNGRELQMCADTGSVSLSGKVGTLVPFSILTLESDNISVAGMLTPGDIIIATQP